MEAIGNPNGRPAVASKAPTCSDLQSLDQREHRPSLNLLLLFLVLATGIITAGYLFYRSYARNFRGQVERGLSSIAELKVGQLVQWRKERLADASVFYRNRAFSGLVERLRETPAEKDVRGRILSWLDRVQDAYQYDRVFILDAQGIERLAVPGTPEPVTSHLLQQIPEILRSDKITFLDFYRDAPDRPIHLDLVVPVREESDDGRPLGVLVLRIDPAVHVYPFIQQWPSPSRTAETLLVRREGDEALFLNELRFRKNSALSLRVPLNKGDVPAVKAALGQEGIVEGNDYRGVPVLADVRGIPDSPWFLVARIDITEVNAPLQERLWLIIGLVAALFFSAGAGLIWRQQRLRSFQARLEAAEALQESEARYRTLFNESLDGICLADAETGLIIDCNQALAALVGRERAELIGQSQTVLHPPYNDQAATSPTFRQHLAHKEGHTLETQVVTSAGIIREVEIKANQLNLQGRKTLQGVFRDITERKRAEEAVRKSEEKYRGLTENVNLGIYRNTVGPEGKFIEANPAIVGMFGYKSKEEFLAINVSELYQNAEGRNKFNDKMLKEGFVRGEELWLKKKDGSPLVGSVSAVAVKDEQGHVKYYDGIIDNITERKRVEEALRESEEKYRAIIETNQEWIWQINNEGIHTYSNPAIEQILGYSIEDIVGKNATIHMHPEGCREIEEMLPKWIENKKGWNNLVLRWLHKDGSIRWLESNAVVMLDVNGELIGFQGSDRDITERKRAEEALRSSLREKEVLLREVHHRVKNNMQVISSLFNLQAGYTTNEECRGILKEGQTRIRSMSLVHEKLYQSRDLSKIDLADYIESLAAHLFHVYLVNPAQVRMETEFEDVSVNINSAVPCGLILNELISNALKHAFPEGRTGVIKIGLRRGPGGAVELRVADDGVGLPEGLDILKAESFGLQIVNLLVDQLEAAIDLDRTKGTAFTMTFRELKYAPRA